MCSPVTFVIVRVYGKENKVFNDDNRAIVKCNQIYEPGAAVKFYSNGREYFGDVITCIQTQEENELCKLITTLDGHNVHIHIVSELSKE